MQYKFTEMNIVITNNILKLATLLIEWENLRIFFIRNILLPKFIQNSANRCDRFQMLLICIYIYWAFHSVMTDEEIDS